MTPELLFAFLVVVVGGGMSVYNAYDAWLDLRALQSVANGRRIIAKTNLRSQAVRAVQFALWTVPVVIVAFDVMAPGEARSSVVVWCLLAGMTSSTVNSSMDRLAKRKLLREYMHGRPPPDNGNGGASALADAA